MDTEKKNQLKGIKVINEYTTEFLASVVGKTHLKDSNLI